MTFYYIDVDLKWTDIDLFCCTLVLFFRYTEMFLFDLFSFLSYFVFAQ